MHNLLVSGIGPQCFAAQGDLNGVAQTLGIICNRRPDSGVRKWRILPGIFGVPKWHYVLQSVFLEQHIIKAFHWLTTIV
jgi:hypothetical protein